MNPPEVEEVDADEWDGVQWLDVLYRWSVAHLHKWPCALSLRVFANGQISLMGVSAPRLDYIAEMEQVATEHARAHIMPKLQATEKP